MAVARAAEQITLPYRPLKFLRFARDDGKIWARSDVVVRDAMVELDLKKLNAPDFTASIREGTPLADGTQLGCRT